MTARASCGDGSSTRGNCSGAPTRRLTLRGRMSTPLRTSSVPITATGTIGAPVSSASRPTPRLGLPSAPGRVRVPSGKITTQSPRSRIRRAVSIASRSPLPRSTGKAPSELSHQAGMRRVKSSRLATKYTGRWTSVPITNGSRNERWLAAMMTPPSRGMCSRPIRRMRKYSRKNGSRIARDSQ